MFYLYSSMVPDIPALNALHDKPAHDITVAVIENARDYKSPPEREAKLARDVADIKRAGYELITEIDLRKYVGNPLRLASDLSAYDIIWVTGGNTFVLRNIMRDSGLEAALPDLLKPGKIYVGASAGAVVLGPSLLGIKHVDDITIVQDPIMTGLGLIPSIVLPHADSPHFGPSIAKAADALRASGLEPILINENEYLVVPS